MIPSKNPANEGSMPGAFREVLKKFLQGVDDCLPAKVVAYDRTNNVATVKPMINVLATDGTSVERAQIAEVPVLAMGGGGFVLSFPIEPGDLGWISASDRDISLYIQGLTESPPNTWRLHSFEDGLFIPDKLRDFTIDGEDSSAVVLQSTDSLTRLSLNDDGRVKLLNSSVEMELASDGSATIENSSGKIELTLDGKFIFEGVSDELVTVLNDLVDVLESANVVPTIPFNADTLNALSAIQARLVTLKGA